jgi:hypothetical protein
VNVLLLVGSPTTPAATVIAEAERLHAAGHRVALGTQVRPSPELAGAVDDVVLVARAVEPRAAPVAAAPAGGAAAPAAAPAAPPTSPTSAAPAPARGVPAQVIGRAKGAARWGRRQLRTTVVEPARSWRTWRTVHADTRLMALARQADVVVAVDSRMIGTVWSLGRELPLPAGPEVVNGIPAVPGALARAAARRGGADR